MNGTATVFDLFYVPGLAQGERKLVGKFNARKGNLSYSMLLSVLNLHVQNGLMYSLKDNIYVCTVLCFRY